MSTKVGNWIKEKARSAKYGITRKSDAEKAFLESTNEDKWGPSNTQMLEVARYAASYKDWEDIKKLFAELFDKTGRKKHRCLKKGLMLLEYIINNGAENMRNEARMFMGNLQNFTYLQEHETGEEAAIEAVIRKKAQDIINLINDNELYQMERDKARKLKSSLTAVTHDGGYGGSYESSTYGGADYDGGFGGGGGGGGYQSRSSYQDDDYGARRGGGGGGRFQEKPQKQKPQQPADEDEYYSDEEEPQPAAPQKKGNFNPFQERQRAQQAAPAQAPAPAPARQNASPFGQQPQQQANPFGQQQQQQRQANPFAQPQQQQQPQFSPFGQQQQQRPMQQQQPQQSSNLDDLLGYSPSAGGQQQQQQQMAPSADDLLFGTPTPQPVQQQYQPPPPPQNDFLDLSAMGQQQQPMQQQPMQQQQQRQQGSGMLAEFGDLVNLNLKGNDHQPSYGRAGFQQRGTGATLGARH